MADMYPKIKAKKRKESGQCEIYVVKHTRKLGHKWKTQIEP